MNDNVIPLRPAAEAPDSDCFTVGDGSCLTRPCELHPGASADSDVIQVKVPVYVLMQAEVLPAVVGGLQVVAFQMTVKNTATGADEYLVIAVASEDAKKLNQRINSVASTVKPVSKQIPTQEDTRP